MEDTGVFGVYAATDVKHIQKTIDLVSKELRLLASHPMIVRCHKSFIVNTEKIIKTSGNSENLVLLLTHCAPKIPVSRNYYHQLKDLLPLKKSSNEKI